MKEFVNKHLSKIVWVGLLTIITLGLYGIYKIVKN